MYKDRKELSKKKYIKGILDYYDKTLKFKETKLTKEGLWWRIFNLYFGSINVFKPLIAMNMYCRYRPKSVLDFTMGWGGRLVGACALNIPRYIGIDLNKQLEKPYKEMKDTLEKHSTTDIKLYFEDALKVDYSKLDYDMVLTSPPYYNIELYNGTKKMSKEDWDNNFYKPIFERTFKYLKKGGHYCLNIPADVYERVAVEVLGKAHEFVPLPKSKRTGEETYKEFIYVWVKK